MDHQGFCIPHVRQVGEHLQGFNKPAARLAPALQFETEHRTAPPGQQFFCQVMIRVARQFRVRDIFHRLVAGQAPHDLPGIGDMLVHSQRQRFHALQDVKRTGGAERRAEVPQALAARPVQERIRAEILGEIDVQDPVVRLRQGRKLAGGIPVEAAGIHHDAADGDPVPADKLGEGVDDDVRAVVEGFQQVRRGQGRIQHQRDLRRVGYAGNRFDVKDLTTGIAYGFRVNQAGFGPDGFPECFRVARVHEGGVDAETGQGVTEQVVGAAVQRVGCDDMAAAVHQRAYRQVDGGHAAGRRYCAGAPFQSGNALFQHRHRRVGDARIDVARPGEVEHGRCLVRFVEHERGGLVDGSGARAGRRVGALPAVQADGVEAGVFQFGH